MRILSTLLLGSVLLANSPVAFAQSFLYERTISVPTVLEDTSVWVLLDTHAGAEKASSLSIVDANGIPVAFKRVSSQENILQQATLLSAPEAANTVEEQDISALIDNNGSTAFQPVSATQYTFRFSFDTPQAPTHLHYKLSSGWIEHVKVRVGDSIPTLRDSYAGTPKGQTIPLSGELGKVFEVSFRAKEGVIRIAETQLQATQTRLLFRAEPSKQYALRYGTFDTVPRVDSSDVFTDANAITGTLGPVRYIGTSAADADNDAIPDIYDNCPDKRNTQQIDRDGDSIGDACDNAPLSSNTLQNDKDKDGIGDAQDNCPDHANSDQKDIDLDGIGWVCDDVDNDGVRNEKDNCVGIANRDQVDLDNNGIGDVCETDPDGDGIASAEDNCSTVHNVIQSDGDNDGIGDSCDNCPFHYNPKQIDRNADGIGDSCEPKNDSTAVRDRDGDGIQDTADVCPDIADPEQEDTDGDGVGNRCDNCPDHNNPRQQDSNRDGHGDYCTDTDSDGILDPLDNCRTYANEDQEDSDEDGKGNPCDDDDGDRIENARDNCRYISNANQADEDKDGVGNVCDSSDDRWSEKNPWILKVILGVIIVVLVGLGGVILRKSEQ